MGKNKSKKKHLNKAFKVSRWLHVYSSTALFALLIFFCITGIWLNHRWYDEENYSQQYVEYELSDEMYLGWDLLLDTSTEEQIWTPDTTAIAEYLRQEQGLKQPSSMDIDADLGELAIEYKVPAGFASVLIISEEQLMTIETETGSTVGILNDLHKGRNSGSVWYWVIDLSAALIFIFAITGMIILFQGKKYRREGLLSALAGVVTPLIIYFLFVPSIGN